MQDIFDGNEIKTPNSNIPVPLDVNFTPNNPATIQGTATSLYPTEGDKMPFEAGAKAKPYQAGVIETAATQFGRTSDINHIINFLDRSGQDRNPFDDEVPTGWKPTDDQSAFDGVQSQHIGYLLNATSPKDLRRRYNYVLGEQQKDELVKNGSTLGWLVGGFGGMTVGSPENFIPIAGQVKYARYAPTILNSMARAMPGVAMASIIHNAAEQADITSGNLENFVVNSFTDTVFGSLFMGGVAGVSRLVDTSAMWDARKALLPYYHGIDFKAKVSPEGKFDGFQAVDTTGSLSAAQVSYAQDYADSSLSKSGIFKIPYLGEGALKVFGTFSPLVRMLNSRFETARAYVGRIADHSFITKGIEEGKPAPQKFENLWNQLQGSNRALDAQINGLHVARNGFDISNRAVNAVKKTAAKITKNGYISKEAFGKEIRGVLINEQPSEHAAVNEAAALIRKSVDDSYRAFRQAYGLSEEWMSPKTAQGYLMRVYNTPYMIAHENEWHEAITGWLKEADETILGHMQPIEDLRSQIKLADSAHAELIRQPAITDREVKKSSDNLMGMRRRLNAMEESLQNELRENPDLHIHVDDMNAFSAKEAKQLSTLLKPLKQKEAALNEQKKIVSELKTVVSRKNQAAKKGKTVATAKKQVALADDAAANVAEEESKLIELQKAHDVEYDRLQQMAHNGEIDSRFYKQEPGSFEYTFKDPNDRLRFRDAFMSDAERQTASKAYYNTILNQTPEQTINQVMHKLSGAKENHLKQRTLLVPDNILYDGDFLSHDIMANVASYRNFLGRRTFAKNVFRDITIDGGVEPIIKNLSNEHDAIKNPLNENLAQVKAARADLAAGKEVKETDKELAKRQGAIEKEIIQLKNDFESMKEQMGFTYDKMMGNRVGSAKANRNSRMIMAYTAAIRLGFVPFTMVTDLSANVLQHGLWPFLRDGIVPAIESLGGLLKTKDSEALRKAAPHVNLALQDTLMGHADKNYGTLSIPYVNLGNRVANGLEGLAHVSANVSGTTYIENALQHISAAIMQSKIMESMVAFKNGTLSKKELNNLLKYGLDPKEWADRFVAAFDSHGGGKTKLGGYQSNFWEWADLEASNKMGDTVFRGVKDTVLARGILDAPFFMDNPIGAILMGFKGWTYASLNRYVIPSMQQPDAQKLLGIAFMLGAGALVSPTRRLASGKSPYPDNVTSEQIAWAAFQDSGYFSFFGDMISDMNLLSGGVLNRDFLGNLKNDRYRDRTLAGLLGPSAGVVQDLYSIAGMAASGEVNQNDINKMVRLMPFTQTSLLRGLSNKLTEGLQLPKTRAQARRLSANE
jgi:hypothetical protein